MLAAVSDVTSIVDEILGWATKPQHLKPLNGAIATAVAGLSLVLLLIRGFSGWPKFLCFKEHRATAFGFALFWLPWWVALAVTYWTSPGISRLLINDLGDFAMITFAVVYMRGDSVKLRPPWPQSVVRMICLFGTLIIFQVLLLLARHWRHDTLTWQILAIAPPLVLASIAVLAFGWAMFVRWGLTALPLFAVTILYAIAQAPAHFQYYVVQPSILSTVERLEADVSAIEAGLRRFSRELPNGVRRHQGTRWYRGNLLLLRQSR